jgi:hypothetical protein
MPIAACLVILYDSSEAIKVESKQASKQARHCLPCKAIKVESNGAHMKCPSSNYRDVQNATKEREKMSRVSRGKYSLKS